MPTTKDVIAWKVVFEDGSVELHAAESIQGEPTFGRWITPMIAGGETIDLEPAGYRAAGDSAGVRATGAHAAQGTGND